MWMFFEAGMVGSDWIGLENICISYVEGKTRHFVIPGSALFFLFISLFFKVEGREYVYVTAGMM